MCTVAAASGVEAQLWHVAWMHGFMGVGRGRRWCTGGAGVRAARGGGDCSVDERAAQARRLWRVAHDCARECRAWRLRRGDVKAGDAWSVAAAA